MSKKFNQQIIYCVISCLLLMLVFTAWKAPGRDVITPVAKYSVIRNVIYGTNVTGFGKKQDLDMDIYLPDNLSAKKKYPMVMLIHGGTFLNGKKEDMAQLCQQLAKSGFVAVTINYRLGWYAASALGGCANLDVTGLTLANYRATQDAHAAMRYIWANATKYHIDNKWLFIGGGSAGAIMALNVAYFNEKFINEKFSVAVDVLGKLDTAGNVYPAKFKIKGICDMWGALPDSTLITRKNALPTIFYHGTADKTIPYERGYYIPNCTRLPELFGSACLYRQTVAEGQIAVLNTSIGGKHGPVEYTPSVIASNTACFFHKVMNGKAKSGVFRGTAYSCR